VAISRREGCVCETDAYYVNCSSSSFNSFSLIFPTNFRELVLYRNSITSLEDRFISSGLTELEEISFNDCEIETINLRAFSGLRKLALLSMCCNRLREITPRIFEKMNRMEYLVLVDNFIEHLEVDLLDGLINLKYFNLINKLQAVHPDVFLELTKI